MLRAQIVRFFHNSVTKRKIIPYLTIQFIEFFQQQSNNFNNNKVKLLETKENRMIITRIQTFLNLNLRL